MLWHECSGLIDSEMPIDYSKWDNLDTGSNNSDSDSDSQYEQVATNVTGPRVTRLDAPGRVTFGGNHDSSLVTIEPHVSPGLNRPAVALTDRIIPHNDSAAPIPVDPWTSRGAFLVTSDDRQLYWSQDRYSVQIRLELRPNEAVRQVHVEGILSFADRNCATGSHKHHLTITGRLTSEKNKISDTITFLDGDLPHHVHWSQDDDSECQGLDWTIEGHPVDTKRRFVSITLHKAVPMQGLFVWWKRPLMQCDEIALNDNENADRSAASQEFLQAWEEAHRVFRENKRHGTHSLPR